MKIELKNFGPILYFEFDLEKDLHIIYGENNVGKSYAIAAVYLIIKNLRESLYFWGSFRFYEFPQLNELSKFIKTKIGIGKKKKDELIISEQYNELLKEILNGIFVEGLRKSISNSFSNVKNKFNERENTEIRLIFSKFSLVLSFVDNDWIITDFNYMEAVTVKYIDKENVLEPTRQERRKYIYIKYSNARVDSIKDEIGDKLTESFSHIRREISKHIRGIHFLPASRSGLYQGLTTLPPILARLSQVRYALKGSLEIPALPEPVSDYFLALSNAQSSKAKTHYTELAQRIEQDILDAEITFDNDSSKIEYYNKVTNLRLDISETSSMISEIAPIVAYLKFIIDNPDRDYFFHIDSLKDKGSHLMFIEEPEAHLHPKMQVKMMEIFAAMVNANIKVVMTTHSDYLKDKLTNLLLSKALSPKQVSSYHFVMGEQGSYDAGDMKATEDGIEDHNFSSVAEALYEERLKIYESLNETDATQEN